MTAVGVRPAIAYVRVSTEEQAREGVSLDAQARAVRSYCEMRRLPLAEVVIDAGVSAGKPLAKRDGGAAILTAVKRREVGAVIAFKLDRLFRDCADCLSVVGDWDRLGALTDVEEACSAAGFDDVLADLPRGMDTVLGRGGVGLSLGQRQRLGVVLKVDTEFPLILIGPELFSFIGLETEAQQLEFIGMQVLIGILPVDEGFRKGGMGGFPDESKRKTIHRHRSWPFVLNPEVDPFLADTGGQNEIQPGRRHCFQAERLAVFQDLYLILPVQPYSYGNFPMAAPPLLTDLQQTGIVAWHAGAFYTIQ